MSSRETSRAQTTYRRVSTHVTCLTQQSESQQGQKPANSSSHLRWMINKRCYKSRSRYTNHDNFNGSFPWNNTTFNTNRDIKKINGNCRILYQGYFEAKRDIMLSADRGFLWLRIRKYLSCFIEISNVVRKIRKLWTAMKWAYIY